MAAEIYALAHGFDAGFILAHTVRKLLNRTVNIRVFTDSRTLFDSIVSLCTAAEKRLMIDIFCLREAYRNGDLANLGWIRRQHNIADALTKDLKSSALNDVLRTHITNTPVQQRVEGVLLKINIKDITPLLVGIYDQIGGFIIPSKQI